MKIFRLFFLLYIILISGCKYTWYFKVTDLENINFPTFCVSSSNNCKGKGVNLPTITVHELDKKGQWIEPAWVINNTADFEVKRFKYGEVPTGFTEIKPAKPLKEDTVYTINGEHYFIILKNIEEVKVEYYNQKEFLQKFRRAND